MTDRDGAKERVYTRLETNLRLIGATAIEDKLQVSSGEGWWWWSHIS